MKRLILVLVICFAAQATQAEQLAHVGDVYKIVQRVESSQKNSNGSSGSSNGRNTLLERVINISENGLELEYDLPKATSAEDRARNWQFPVRVLKPVRGQMHLLNRAELETRVDAWLKLGNLPRSACGRWIFTWTAIRIECDPQSVIELLAQFDLEPEDLRDGGVYSDSSASAPASYKQTANAENGSTFEVELTVDPNRVRREQAQNDVALAEMTGKRLTIEEALKTRATDQVSGTISVSFETDQSGHVRRKTKVTKIEIIDASGRTDARSTTETVERKLVLK